MILLKELEGFRVDVPPPGPEARAGGRRALTEAVRIERVERDKVVRRPQLVSSGDGPQSQPRSGRLSRRAALGAAAALAAAAAVIGLLTATPNERTPAGHRSAGRSGASTLPLSRGVTLPLSRGVTLRLAGYNFALPAGFQTFAGQCPHASSPSRKELKPHVWKSAKAVDGGCVEVEVVLAAGTAVVPPSPAAEPVPVGSYQGYLLTASPATTQSSTGETLYVVIPSAQGDSYLVLSAVGLTPAQLIAMAEAALPGAPGTTTPCSNNCG
jgi:hypothetical protein